MFYYSVIQRSPGRASADGCQLLTSAFALMPHYVSIKTLWWTHPAWHEAGRWHPARQPAGIPVLIGRGPSPGRSPFPLSSHSIRTIKHDHSTAAVTDIRK